MSLEFELPLFSFVFLAMLCFFYFIKPKVEVIENKYFETILKCSLINSIINTIIHFICSLNDFNTINLKYYTLFNFLNKILVIMFVMIFSGLLCYTIIISYKQIKEKYKLVQRYYLIFNVIFSIVTLFTNIELIDARNVINVKGTTTILGYTTIAILMSLSIIIALINIKKFDKRYFAIFFILFIVLFLALLTFLFPGIILYDVAAAIFCYIMYFTIENPDVKMIDNLELAKEQADKANNAKTEFLSSMSHEIRTPLNAIVGFSDYIMTSESLEEVKDNAKNILEASNTLLEIVNGILDISKIEAGKMEIINSKYNAREIYGSIYKLISPKMKEKGLEFDYYISSDVPETLYGDHANIKKVITEIINNAYKYTDMGYVRYKVNCKNTEEISQLIITIEDSGRGIKQENVNKIFNKFERLEQDRNTTIEGTGLGLSLTKQLIALMGGEVIVETAFGAGTKFTIILNQKIETSPVEPTLELDTTLDLTDKNILIVDDNSLNIKVTKKLLERHNATNIEYTTNGYDCVEKIKRGAVFDLIFLDDMMPKISGIETFKLLKEIPDFNQPVVIFTANAIAGMREQYLSQGFTDYLAKPIDKNELIRVCNTILYKGQPQTNQPISSVEKVATVEQVTPVQQNQIANQVEEVELIEPVTPVQQIEEVELIEPISQIESTTSVVNVSQNNEIYLRQNGVDLDKSLELLGDIDMYNMTISDFLSEVEEKWQNIIEYKNINDMKNYAIEVHSLKSDAKYLGFTPLAEIAYQHELKSKENDFVFVNEHFNELQIEYSKALELAKNYNQMIN